VLCCLRDLGLPLDHPAMHDAAALFEGQEEFRQHLGGRLTLTLLRGVGDPTDVHEVEHALMRRAMERVAHFAASPGIAGITTPASGSHEPTASPRPTTGTINAHEYDLSPSPGIASRNGL